jgi:hypothetical protein
MKPAILLLALPLVIAMSACKKSKKESDIVEINKMSGTSSIPLSGCKTWAFTNDDVKICYDSLVEDSRCPIGGVCVWAGRARAKFSFHLNNQKHSIALTTSGAEYYRVDTVIGNYLIELIDIAPYPGQFPAPQSSATVKISRQ